MSSWTDEEDRILINFLIVKSKNADSPLNVVQLSREFVDKNETSRSVNSVNQRIRQIRLVIDELPEIGEDEKIQLKFALKPVPIPKPRAIKRKVSKQIGDLLHFLAEFSKTKKLPVNRSDILNAYIKSVGFTGPKNSLFDEYEMAKKRIFKYSKYDLNTKVRMTFVSSLRVNHAQLKKLRESAIVELDAYRHIMSYTANDKSLKLQKKKAVRRSSMLAQASEADIDAENIPEEF